MKKNLQKKLALSILIGTLTFTGLPPMDILPTTDMQTATVEAARGGMRAPRVTTPKAPATSPSANTAKTGPNQKDYAPSKKASDLNKEAPKANTSNATQAGNTSTNSTFGNILRGAGLLAGGMMLGGLLSSLFGFGAEGMMASILGMLSNIAIAVIAFLAIRWAWNKFKNRNTSNSNPYQTNPYQTRPNQTPQNPLPLRRDASSNQPQRLDIIERSDATGDYQAKSTADRYRNR